MLDREVDEGRFQSLLIEALSHVLRMKKKQWIILDRDSGKSSGAPAYGRSYESPIIFAVATLLSLCGWSVGIDEVDGSTEGSSLSGARLPQECRQLKQTVITSLLYWERGEAVRTLAPNDGHI